MPITPSQGFASAGVAAAPKIRQISPIWQPRPQEREAADGGLLGPPAGKLRLAPAPRFLNDRAS